MKRKEYIRISDDKWASIGDYIEISYGANSHGSGKALFLIKEFSKFGNVYGEVWKKDKSVLHAKRKKLDLDRII